MLDSPTIDKVMNADVTSESPPRCNSENGLLRRSPVDSVITVLVSPVGRLLLSSAPLLLLISVVSVDCVTRSVHGLVFTSVACSVLSFIV